jgi:hypothetical protein
MESPEVTLKTESLEKWRKIVKDLEGTGRGNFPLLCRDCGYCKFYLIYYKEDNWWSFDNCYKCPLFRDDLCVKGFGRAYFKVNEYYNKIKDEIEVTEKEKTEALIEAERMLEAIENDLVEHGVKI